MATAPGFEQWWAWSVVGLAILGLAVAFVVAFGR